MYAPVAIVLASNAIAMLPPASRSAIIPRTGYCHQQHRCSEKLSYKALGDSLV
jgi:hypothetical protein